MNEMKAIERAMKVNYYLYRYAWPLYRTFVRHTLSKRCSICSLPEKVVKIQDDSICDICHQEETSSAAPGKGKPGANPLMEKELDQLLIETQGKGGGAHDVIFLFSGGKDSTYILNRLRNDYRQLRILALTVDNGFRSPIGKQNAERICARLDVDHMEIRPYRIFRKLYKYGFENFSHLGFVCTDFWEGELFQDIGRNLAAQMDIPLIILGYTPEQIAFIPKEFDEHRLYGSKDFRFRENQAFTRQKFVDIDLKNIFTPEEMCYWWDASKWPAERIPSMVFPFQAWGYSKTNIIEEVISLLRDVLDGKDTNPMLTNDIYVGFGIYLDYRIFGYSPMYEEESSRYVRTGRDDGKQNRNLWEFIEYAALRYRRILDSVDMRACLAKLGLTKATINGIIKKSRDRLDEEKYREST
uniref:Queuosine biosynthesis protein QueC n=1 Tax=Candidatus Kentrum sp. SD TaxID=2126332 RepID=A0A451BJ78_9GAMM|nr:MAG: Queuosine biosynthesis protein QueC [Candidatus Kentron sp. SD]VFK40412.1 MAG: Queuosine biosynthesis protein QueC [Candidatus Kentron sp. SD]VFK78344.1 MAG: Queuosine biosynthesis protein QueC [Candidatus Kentron sp. SD]